MELELAITSYQRLSPTVVSSQRFSSSQKYVLGRAKDCDWALPDPDRVISSRHAEIECRDGQFWLKDTSTNGVFVNGGLEPLGAGGEVALKDGDSLRFGDYEFSVSVLSAGAEMPVDVGLGASAQETVGPKASSPVNIPAPSGRAHTGLVGASSGATAVGVGASGFGDVPVGESQGGNPTLASGLNEHRLADSHVDMPDVSIPTDWHWGEDGKPQKRSAKAAATAVPTGEGAGDHLAALFEGLGMPQLAEKNISPEMMRDLGGLTRILLDRLLDLLRARAEQKQKLRVQQTLFQRSENNPLKFSATAQDAVDALLLRRHSSFLGPKDAVEEAFADVQAHERALMAGVESVVAELLDDSSAVSGAASLGKFAIIRKARAYDAWVEQRAQQYDEFGDNNRMLRSDSFVEAYEAATRESE